MSVPTNSPTSTTAKQDPTTPVPGTSRQARPTPRMLLEALRQGANPGILEAMKLLGLLPVSDRIELLQHQLLILGEQVEVLSKALAQVVTQLNLLRNSLAKANENEEGRG